MEKKFLIWFIFTFFQLLVALEIPDEENQIPAILVASRNESFCSLMTNVSQEFHFCSFVYITETETFSSSHPKFVLFSLELSNQSIDIVYITDGYLAIDFGNGTYYTVDHIVEIFKWTHLCFQLHRDKKVEVIMNEQLTVLQPVNGLYGGNRFRPPIRGQIYMDLYGEEAFQTDEDRNLVSLAQITNGKFCAGEVQPFDAEKPYQYSCQCKIASLSFSNTLMSFSQAVKMSRNRRCREILDGKDVKEFTCWKDRCRGSKHITVSAEDICADVRSIAIIKDKKNYKEDRKICHSMQGRFLRADEAAELRAFVENKVDPAKCRTKLDNFTTYTYWLESGDNPTKHKCIQYTYEGHQMYVNCLRETLCSVCLTPRNLKATLYTDEKSIEHKYDYVDDHLMKGNTSAAIENLDGTWQLRSNRFIGSWTLQNATAPFGRWYWSKNGTIKSFTLTSCNMDEFVCDYGECIPEEQKCDGTKNCEDNSDEAKCIAVETMIGYNHLISPPPLTLQSSLEIEYYTFIYSINDIKVSEGNAVLDLVINLYWKDPRIRFWDQKKNEAYNCSQMWTPQLMIMDQCGEETGSIVEFDVYVRTCTLGSGYQDPELSYTKELEDPDMGRYVAGDKISLVLSQHGILTTPCRFQLHTYPFGDQTCGFCFKVMNLPDHIMMGREKFNDTDKVEYKGQTSLGEFIYVSAKHKEKNGFVHVELQLKSLSTFHNLNSFTPSIMIFLIAYGTLFFPMPCYNERIMVSLTALLVLSALFSQSSDVTIQTTYIKHIDIWYVAHIGFCFAIVLFNSLMLRFHVNQLDQVKVLDKEPSFYEKWTNLSVMNFFCRWVFGILFTIFATCFFISAYDLI